MKHGKPFIISQPFLTKPLVSHKVQWMSHIIPNLPPLIRIASTLQTHCLHPLKIQMYTGGLDNLKSIQSSLNTQLLSPWNVSYGSFIIETFIFCPQNKIKNKIGHKYLEAIAYWTWHWTVPLCVRSMKRAKLITLKEFIPYLCWLRYCNTSKMIKNELIFSKSNHILMIYCKNISSQCSSITV